MTERDENRIWDAWASPTQDEIDRELRAYRRFVLAVLSLVLLVVGTVAYWVAQIGQVLL
jgi:hypothetical protein